jgi:hypothetical protein
MVWEKWPVFGPAAGRRKRIPGAARSFFHRLARARSRAPQQSLVSLLGARALELFSGSGLRAGTGPLGRVAKDTRFVPAAREAPSLHEDELSQIGPEKNA